jgi:hypothetical protein
VAVSLIGTSPSFVLRVKYFVQHSLQSRFNKFVVLK